MKPINVPLRIRCLTIVAVGLFASVACMADRLNVLGWMVFALSATGAILLAESEIVSRVESLRSVSLPQLAADQQSLTGIYNRFPELHMPVTTQTMRASNIAAIIDIMDRLCPETVVELGSGLSTLYIAARLRQQGHGRLISYEHDDHWANLCRDYLVRHHLDHIAEIVVVPLKPMHVWQVDIPWYDIKTESKRIGMIDLLVIDGPPATPQIPLTRLPAMFAFSQRLSDKAEVFLDDGSRPGERKIVRVWEGAFPSFHACYQPSLTGYWVLARKKDLSLRPSFLSV